MCSLKANYLLFFYLNPNSLWKTKFYTHHNIGSYYFIWNSNCTHETWITKYSKRNSGWACVCVHDYSHWQVSKSVCFSFHCTWHEIFIAHWHTRTCVIYIPIHMYIHPYTDGSSAIVIFCQGFVLRECYSNSTREKFNMIWYVYLIRCSSSKARIALSEIEFPRSYSPNNEPTNQLPAPLSPSSSHSGGYWKSIMLQPEITMFLYQLFPRDY